MIRKIFIDSNIILDVATGREPFVNDSKNILSLAENGYVIGVISANSVTNIYYILRKISSSEKAKLFLKNIFKYISVISIGHGEILTALDSKFLDFEDGVQNYCAIKNQCDLIVTRNVRDYTFSEIEVIDPKEFILRYKNN